MYQTITVLSSPRYSPTSPVYSPSPIQIDSENESEHGFTPPNNNNDPIITRAVDMFDPTNTDSDQELDEEVAINKFDRGLHK